MLVFVSLREFKKSILVSMYRSNSRTCLFFDLTETFLEIDDFLGRIGPFLEDGREELAVHTWAVVVKRSVNGNKGKGAAQPTFALSITPWAFGFSIT